MNTPASIQEVSSRGKRYRAIVLQSDLIKRWGDQELAFSQVSMYKQGFGLPTVDSFKTSFTRPENTALDGYLQSEDQLKELARRVEHIPHKRENKGELRD